MASCLLKIFFLKEDIWDIFRNSEYKKVFCFQDALKFLLTLLETKIPFYMCFKYKDFYKGIPWTIEGILCGKKFQKSFMDRSFIGLLRRYMIDHKLKSYYNFRTTLKYFFF